MIRYIKEHRICFAVAILLNATSMSNVISLIMNKDFSILSNVFLIVAILLLIDFSYALNLKLYIKNKQTVIFFLFIVYIIMMAFFYDYSFAGIAGAQIYNFFSLIIMLALMTNVSLDNRELLVETLFWFSGIITVITAVVLTNGFTNFSFQINSIYMGTKTIVDRLTLAISAYNFGLVAIVYKPKTKISLIFKITGIISMVMVFFATSRRGKIVELIVALTIFLFSNFTKKTTSINRNKIKKVFFGVIIGFIVIYFANKNVWIAENIQRLLGSIQRAFYSLIGSGAYSLDESANSRYLLRNNILSEYKTYSLIETLFGKGYMYRYLDFPLLQAFIDLGIFGGTFYLLMLVILPLRFILHKSNDKSIIVIQLFLVGSVIDLFFNGIPYGWDRFLMMMIALFYFDFNKNVDGRNGSVEK